MIPTSTSCLIGTCWQWRKSYRKVWQRFFCFSYHISVKHLSELLVPLLSGFLVTLAAGISVRYGPIRCTPFIHDIDEIPSSRVEEDTSDHRAGATNFLTVNANQSKSKTEKLHKRQHSTNYRSYRWPVSLFFVPQHVFFFLLLTEKATPGFWCSTKV